MLIFQQPFGRRKQISDEMHSQTVRFIATFVYLRPTILLDAEKRITANASKRSLTSTCSTLKCVSVSGWITRRLATQIESRVSAAGTIFKGH